MKGTAVIIFILLSTSIASWRFAHKDRDEQDGMDHIAADLQDLRHKLSPAANISVITVNTPVETVFWVRYALAPISISTDNNELHDTTLTITRGPADSLLQGRKLLWLKTGDPYHYYLSSRQ